MITPRIIGLSGLKMAGKDTVAAIVRELVPSYQRMAFADVLKDMAVAIDPYVLVTENEGLRGVKTSVHNDYFHHDVVRLSNVVDALGWDRAKHIPDVRRFLQRLGTEGGREHLGPDVWVNATMDKLPLTQSFGNYVFTDVRFPSEFAAIREFHWVTGGVEMWRIERPGLDDTDLHASELSWRDEKFNLTIMNDGSLDWLRSTVAMALGVNP
jgi:hypothetical protein